MAGLRSTVIALLLAACTRHEDSTTMRLPTDRAPPAPPPDGAPVALNAESPVSYPPELLAQGIEGTVLLRLFVDSSGKLVPESTRVAESSGYPALDSAAVAATPELRFAPALHAGTPVATAFLQPVQFRRTRGGR
jgi:TonB family protein